MAKQVKVTGKTITLSRGGVSTRLVKGDTTKYSMTKTGKVPTRQVDSIKKVNPALGKLIGSGGKQYGTTRYGENASDAIRTGLKGNKK